MQEKWWVRLALWIATVSGYYWFAKLWDYALYVYVVLKFGPVIGIPIMLFASLALDLASVVYYLKRRKDVFGVEEFKRRREKNDWIGKILRSGDGPLFIGGSIISNPFVVTILLNRGEGRRMEKRDVKIFAYSFLLSHLSWIVAIYGTKLAANWLAGR